MKKFRRTPWRFQRTFHTPLKQLDSFTSSILGSLGHIESATLTIESIVFEAKNLNALMASHHLHPLFQEDVSIVGETASEVHSLLAATLADWVDFLFVPVPKPFVLYADHDEYATFFANTKGNLNAVASSLAANGFAEVENYTRKHGR